jgi:hypothetical protein
MKILIIVASALVILVSGFQIWNHNNKQAQLNAANNYAAAIENNDINALNALAKNASGGTSDLAAFKSYLFDKDIKKLQDLSENGDTRDFRDLAKIHLARILGDKMTADEFEKFMTPLDKKKSPFYYNAALLVAQKYTSVGDKENAKKWLDKIDNDAPNTVSLSAQYLK